MFSCLQLYFIHLHMGVRKILRGGKTGSKYGQVRCVCAVKAVEDGTCIYLGYVLCFRGWFVYVLSHLDTLWPLWSQHLSPDNLPRSRKVHNNTHKHTFTINVNKTKEIIILTISNPFPSQTIHVHFHWWLWLVWV